SCSSDLIFSIGEDIFRTSTFHVVPTKKRSTLFDTGSHKSPPSATFLRKKWISHYFYGQYLAVSISFGPNGSVGRCPKVTSHVVDFFFDESSSNSHLTGAAVTIRSHPARTMLHNGQQIKYYQRRECIGCWCPSWTSKPMPTDRQGLENTSFSFHIKVIWSF